MKKTFLICILSVLWFSGYAVESTVVSPPIKIVAAENFYGELAQEIGGNAVKVTSIISNPDADPHLFTTSVATNKAIASAQIIIYNGADYDSWMEQMLKSVDNKKVSVINVADLMHIKSGSNPHLWYKPETFPTLAKVLASQMISVEGEGVSSTDQNTQNENLRNKHSKNKIQAQIRKNLEQFLNQNLDVRNKVALLKAKYAGTKVTATEPVFGYMADAMGLNMQGLDFQWKIMNNTDPSPKMLAAYESLITSHVVKILFYNNQVTDPVTKNILTLAKKNNIPVVGVTETMPLQTKINPWLVEEISRTENALQSSQN